jgi:hypothetical protein
MSAPNTTAAQALALLRTTSLSHADLKALIGHLCTEAAALNADGTCEGYDEVSERLDGAFIALDRVYALCDELEADEGLAEINRRWADDAAAFNRGQ